MFLGLTNYVGERFEDYLEQELTDSFLLQIHMERLTDRQADGRTDRDLLFLFCLILAVNPPARLSVRSAVYLLHTYIAAAIHG